MKFKGFRRSDGSVGIRNHVVILPGCICSAGAARKIAAAAEGTTYLYNPNGCAQNTEDTAITLEPIRHDCQRQCIRRFNCGPGL